MKKRTFLKVLLCLMLCAAVLGWFQLRPYRVEDDGSNLTQELLKNHEQAGFPSPLNLLDTLTIGDVRYVTFELGPDHELGRAILKQGPGNRWKIDRSGYGGGNFQEEILVIDDVPYLIFSGKNTGQRIASVEVELENRAYTLALPLADCFLVSTPVELKKPRNHVLPDAFHYFDETGQDISDSVYWNGFPSASSQQ